MRTELSQTEPPTSTNGTSQFSESLQTRSHGTQTLAIGTLATLTEHRPALTTPHSRSLTNPIACTQDRWSLSPETHQHCRTCACTTPPTELPKKKKKGRKLTCAEDGNCARQNAHSLAPKIASHSEDRSRDRTLEPSKSIAHALRSTHTPIHSRRSLRSLRSTVAAHSDRHLHAKLRFALTFDLTLDHSPRSLIQVRENSRELRERETD
jgi:hypothetical protein